MAKKFGKYEVIEEIARGAMGIVYKARHPALEKTVALKALMEAHEASKDLVERFQAEAKAAAKLRHPHIVPVHDVGVSGGVLYFTMDFIEGTTLQALIEKRTLSHRAAAEMLEKIARALHYAHGQGIVHRDVKPANILIDREGVPYVTDFGLAKEVSSDAKATGKKGATVGTPEYMSPEQAEGRQDVDFRTDVYSLGATLYKALTGKPVFSGEHLLAVLRRIRFDEPRPPSRTDPSIPRDLETICLKCLEKVPERRYASALELAEDLERFAKGEPILARPIGLLESLGRRARRQKWVLIAVAGGVLATGVAALAFSRMGRAEVEAAHQDLDRMRQRLTALKTMEMDLDRMIPELRRIAESAKDPADREQARSLLAAFESRKAAEEPRESPDRALAEAAAFWRENPLLLDRAQALFLRVREAFPGSGAAGKADGFLDRIDTRRRERAQAAFEETLAKARALEKEKRFREAIDAWIAAVPLMAGTSWEAKASEGARDAADRAWRAFDDAKEAADGFAKRGDFAAARGAMEEVSRFGFPVADARAREALKAIARSEAEFRASKEAATPGEAAAEAALREKESAAALEETTAAALDAARESDPDRGAETLAALARCGLSEKTNAEARARARDFFAAGALLAAALEELRAAARSGASVTLLLGKPGAEPQRRSVTVEAVLEGRLRVRTMGAATTIAVSELHPLGWAELGLSGARRRDPEALAGAGLILLAGGCPRDAGRRLEEAAAAGRDARWLQDLVSRELSGVLEARAATALDACRKLFETGNQKALGKALSDFRRDFGDTKAAAGASAELASWDAAAGTPEVELAGLFAWKPRALPGGRSEFSYGFRDRRELGDWGLGYSPYGPRAERGEAGGGLAILQGMSLVHAARFEGDLDLQTEVLIKDASMQFAIRFQNLFLVYTQNGDQGGFELRPGPFGDRIGVAAGKSLKEETWTPLRMTRTGNAVQATLGRDLRLAVSDPNPRPGPVGLFAITGAVQFRAPQFAGKVTAAWADRERRHLQLRAEGLAELKNVPWETILVAGKDSGWVRSPEGAWKVERNAWTARGGADDARAWMETTEPFEDVSVEALLQYDGKGRFLAELRVGEARAAFTIPPGPATRRFEASAAGPVVAATLDGVPLLPEQVVETALPGTLRFTLFGKGTACLQQVQVKRARWRRLAALATIPLFDGKTLSEWFAREDQEGSWTVEGGTIVGQSSGEWSVLRTDGAFDNFRLSLKVMALEGEGPRLAVRWHYEGMALSCPAPDGKWHAVEIVAKGNQCAATVDGQPASLLNTDRKGNQRMIGNILLAVRRGKAAFKDVVVAGIP